MIVLITGATSGIGKATALKFVSEGAKVIATGRRSDKLEELYNSAGGNLLPLELDVRDHQQIVQVLANLPNEFKSIDVLINNAGLSLGLDLAHNASLNDWEVMVDTNVKGLMYVTHALLPGMVERNCGHIVNIGSIAGEFPYPGGNVYGATKAFVMQLSHNLKADLFGTPIRVTNIEPGMVGETEFSEIRFGGNKAKAQEVYQGAQPLTPEDVADTVYWAATRPAHVNINNITLMPVGQAFNSFRIQREKETIA